MDDIKMEDIRQTKEWKRYLQSSGWVVEKVNLSSHSGRVHPHTRRREALVSVFIRKITLTPFSMMKVQRFDGELDFSDLKRLKRRHRVIYTVLEPLKMGLQGWRINKHPFLPTETVVVNLNKSKGQLWNDLSTNAKRILNKSSMVRTIELRGRDGREEFYKAWKKSSKTWVMSEERFNKLLDAFGKKASIWVSESESELFSGVVLLRSKDTANYSQTWTSKKGRGLGSHYKLIWQVILECKKKGLKWFDFEGVLDKRWPQKKWAGFSEFKKKFGGTVVTYPGSFTKWF